MNIYDSEIRPLREELNTTLGFPRYIEKDEEDYDEDDED